MSPAAIIAICLLSISLGSFCIFVAGAMNAASNADDADEAMMKRLIDGDTRDASK